MEVRAKRYSRIKYKLALIDVAYTLLLLFLLQVSGIASSLKTALTNLSIGQPIIVAAYTAAIFIMYTILSFFLDLYRSFILEHSFGLTKQKLSSWFLDYIKGNILGLIVFVILIEGFYFFIRNCGTSWWWMGAAFWIFLSVVIARTFPVIVIPLFFKYKKLENEDLRNRILALAKKMGVKILDVFEIDFSKKSLKANAAFVGMGRSRRVLLTDTLLNGKFTNEEIEVILAHEFAHYRFKHLVKMVAMNAVIMLLTFYIFFRISNLGLDVKDIANLGSWLLLFMLFQIATTPFTNFVSRRMEANADGEAIRMNGKKEPFISMMSKLCEQNLAERNPPLWAKVLFYDHPPIDERIEHAKNMRGPSAPTMLL